MITLAEAKNLKLGEILIHTETGKRWKVTGKVQTWVRDKNRIRVPLKHGLYQYDALKTEDFNEYGECVFVTREAVIEADANRYKEGGVYAKDSSNNRN